MQGKSILLSVSFKEFVESYKFLLLVWDISASLYCFWHVRAAVSADRKVWILEYCMHTRRRTICKSFWNPRVSARPKEHEKQVYSRLRQIKKGWKAVLYVNRLNISALTKLENGTGNNQKLNFCKPWAPLLAYCTCHLTHNAWNFPLHFHFAILALPFIRTKTFSRLCDTKFSIGSFNSEKVFEKYFWSHFWCRWHAYLLRQYFTFF